MFKKILAVLLALLTLCTFAVTVSAKEIRKDFNTLYSSDGSFTFDEQKGVSKENYCLWIVIYDMDKNYVGGWSGNINASYVTIKKGRVTVDGYYIGRYFEAHGLKGEYSVEASVYYLADGDGIFDTKHSFSLHSDYLDYSDPQASKPGFFQRAWQAIKNFFMAVINFFRHLFVKPSLVF